jgi:hypothetical protein
MAEQELPPTRSIHSLMSRLSALAPVAGAAVTFGTLGVVHMAAAVLIGVLATFVVFAGLLMVSDWRTDVQSRQDWAQLGLTPAHLSLAVELAPASALDSSYRAPGKDEAFRHVFRANLVAAQIARHAPRSVRPPEFPSSQLEGDQGSVAAVPSKIHAFEHRLRTEAGTPARVAFAATRPLKGKRRKKEIASRLRLVANGDAWPPWAPHLRPPIEGAAEVIVLSAGQDDRAQPRLEAPVGPDGADSTAQPACRGPPQVVARRRGRSAPAAKQPRDLGADTSAVDIVVSDNLGRKIPITREELEAIETYLEADLRALFSSRTPRESEEGI